MKYWLEHYLFFINSGNFHNVCNVFFILALINNNNSPVFFTNHHVVKSILFKFSIFKSHFNMVGYRCVMFNAKFIYTDFILSSENTH